MWRGCISLLLRIQSIIIMGKKDKKKYQKKGRLCLLKKSRRRGRAGRKQCALSPPKDSGATSSDTRPTAGTWRTSVPKNGKRATTRSRRSRRR